MNLYHTPLKKYTWTFKIVNNPEPKNSNILLGVGFVNKENFDVDLTNNKLYVVNTLTG